MSKKELSEATLEEALVQISKMSKDKGEVLHAKEVCLNIPSENISAYIDGLENAVIELKEIAFEQERIIKDLVEDGDPYLLWRNETTNKLDKYRNEGES